MWCKVGNSMKLLTKAKRYVFTGLLTFSFGFFDVEEQSDEKFPFIFQSIYTVIIITTKSIIPLLPLYLFKVFTCRLECGIVCLWPSGRIGGWSLRVVVCSGAPQENDHEFVKCFTFIVTPSPACINIYASCQKSQYTKEKREWNKNNGKMSRKEGR